MSNLPALTTNASTTPSARKVEREMYVSIRRLAFRLVQRVPGP